MTIINDTRVQASFTIVTYNRKNIFIIQATEDNFQLANVNSYFKFFKQMAIVHFLLKRRHDIQTNDTQQNGEQKNDIQQNGMQENDTEHNYWQENDT